MRSKTHLSCLFLLPLMTLALAAPAADEPGLAPLTAAQIEQHRMRESDTPSRDLPGYRKLRRVAVARATDEGLAEALNAVAPGVEFVLDPGASAEAIPPGPYDAAIGFSRWDALERIGPVAWVHAYSAGIEHIVRQDAIRKQQPILTNSSGTAAAAIAEHAIGMMMAHARQLHRFRDAQTRRDWRATREELVALPWSVSGKTMLVLGLGAIGTGIAQKAHGLGMTVTATRNSRREGPEFVSYVGLSDEALALAAKADVVANALPLTDQTRGLVDREFFAAMKPTAVYLSVGRGGTTVTDDLLWALRNGEIGGAGLDVTDPEPLPADHPLWQETNAIITPHVAFAGFDRELSTGLMLENLRRYQAGEPLLNVADIDAGY